MENIFSATFYDKEAKIWSGPPKPDIFNTKISIGRAVMFALNQNPDFLAQINCNSGIRRTNREIHDATLRIAVNLEKLGCSRGDVIGFVARNNEDLAPAVLAALLLAAPINALDPTFAIEEMIHMYGITRPKIIFCDNDRVEILKEALKVIKSDAKIIIFGEKIKEHLHIEDLLSDSEDISEFNPPEVDETTCAVIFCSSGTTGLPKGVQTTHRALLFVCSYGYTYGLEMPSTILCFSSIYWSSGLQTILVGSLGGLTRIITTDNYTPDLFYNLLTEYRPGVIFVGPIHLAGIINHPLLDESTLDSVRFFMCGGGITPNINREKAKKYLRNGDLYCCYGMTELCFISREPMHANRSSVGNLIAGISGKVVNKVGEKLGVGQQGELCWKSDRMFRGYYNNSEETKRVMDEDGFVHSGDLGFFDEDNLLHVVGRSKDILEVDYFKVTPAEVENVILTIPGVLEAVVVGVSLPDNGGDLPAAVINLRKGSKVTEREVTELIEKNFSRHKHLRGGVYFVDSFPTTPSGKIKRYLVKEMATKLYQERRI